MEPARLLTLIACLVIPLSLGNFTNAKAQSANPTGTQAGATCTASGGATCNTNSQGGVSCTPAAGSAPGGAGNCSVSTPASQALLNCSSIFGQAAHCGVIIGPTFSTSGRIITSASVVNGIVRSNTDQTVNVSLFGEIHDFITPSGWPVALGPFIAVGAESNNGFAVGGGAMLGFPAYTGSAKGGSTNNSPITFSLGYVFVPNTQTLGDGLVANHPLPAGETQIRYKNATSQGVMLAVGAAF